MFVGCYTCHQRFRALHSGGFSFADFQFGAQNCLPPLNLNRSTNLQVCTSPRLTQNLCWWLPFCLCFLCRNVLSRLFCFVFLIFKFIIFTFVHPFRKCPSFIFPIKNSPISTRTISTIFSCFNFTSQWR